MSAYEFQRNCKFLEVNSHLTTSELGVMLCRTASEFNVKSVLVGSRGMSKDMGLMEGLSRAALGSVSNSMVNNCYEPVTVVKRQL